jgi:hypothetical protein
MSSLRISRIGFGEVRPLPLVERLDDLRELLALVVGIGRTYRRKAERAKPLR